MPTAIWFFCFVKKLFSVVEPEWRYTLVLVARVAAEDSRLSDKIQTDRGHLMKLKTDATLPLTVALILTLWLAIPAETIAQSKKNTSFFKTRIGSGNQELDFILKGIDVEHARYEFSDPNLKGALFRIRIKEFKHGKLVEEKDLTKNASEYELSKYTFDKSKKNFAIHSFARSMDSERLKLKLFFNKGLSFEPIYHRPKTENKRLLPYSLREDFLPYDRKQKVTPVPVGKFFPFLVYSPPFDMGEGRFGFICSNPKFKNLPPEKWSSKAKLPHVIVVELKIELPKESKDDAEPTVTAK